MTAAGGGWGGLVAAVLGREPWEEQGGRRGPHFSLNCFGDIKGKMLRNCLSKEGPRPEIQFRKLMA